MKIGRLIVGIAAMSVAMSIASQVSAADMAVKAPPKAYDPCGVARFTGFYVGGNVGAAAYTSHRNDLDGFFGDNSGWTATDIAPVAGVQIGYDWQSCHAVVGIVADWNWTDASTAVLDEPSDNLGLGQSHQSRMHWFSTIRARAGLAVDNTLFYVTGGLAGARIKTTLTDSDGLVDETFSSDNTRWGLAAGAGAEFALWNNWSVNAEVLYMQFGKETFTTVSTTSGVRAFDLNDSAWVARIGLNYRFDDTRRAFAASMPVKSAAPYYPCGPARFAGPYIGGNIGSLSYRADRNDLDGFLTDNAGWSSTDSSFAAGVQIGWDWQSCHTLVGVVADWSWSDPTATMREEPNDPIDIDQSFRSSMDWFATIRARAGLAVDDTLIYVTGGLAAAKIGTTISEIDGGNNDVFTFDKTRWGLVAGVGTEFVLSGGWSANAELLYMQFTDQQAVINFSPTQTAPFNFDLNDSAWVSRIGLNYRWGNPQTAMPAGATGYPPAAMHFAGFYIGGNVGGLSYQADRNDLDGYLTDNSGWSATDGAVSAGVQIGYDWQSGHKVIGIVADWNWTNVKAVTLDDPNTGPAGVSGAIRSNMDWFATLRTRGGVVVGNTLVYVTGGLAAARIETTYSETALGVGGFSESFTFDDTRWGWTGGAGAEFALVNGWSANAEVLYMQFRDDTVTLDSPNNGGLHNFENNDSAWVARVGLNYRFGGVGKGPVVAKY